MLNGLHLSSVADTRYTLYKIQETLFNVGLHIQKGVTRCIIVSMTLAVIVRLLSMLFVI